MYYVFVRVDDVYFKVYLDRPIHKFMTYVSPTKSLVTGHLKVEQTISTHIQTTQNPKNLIYECIREVIETLHRKKLVAPYVYFKKNPEYKISEGISFPEQEVCIYVDTFSTK